MSAEMEREAYEAGYLAAMRHLREMVAQKTAGFRAAEAAAGDFRLIFNGVENGVEMIVSAFESHAVRHLTDRRRS